MSALQPIGPEIWHLQRHFKTAGIGVSVRMTVVRLHDGRLWLHSPVRLEEEDVAALNALGPVAYIVAPNKVHHLFAKRCAALFPNARIFGAPDLAQKRPDITGIQTLDPHEQAEWHNDLTQCFIAGIPFANETAWFHIASRTLILTDLCQWWRGDLDIGARIYTTLTGVRNRLAVPITVRLVVRDRQALRKSVETILAWPFERVVMAHNTVVANGEHGVADVRDAVRQAFQFALK